MLALRSVPEDAVIRIWDDYQKLPGKEHWRCACRQDLVVALGRVERERGWTNFEEAVNGEDALD